MRDEILELMSGGEWWTLSELHGALGRSGEASISARLRELRGRGFVVDKRPRGDRHRGLWEYRVTQERRRNSLASLRAALRRNP